MSGEAAAAGFFLLSVILILYIIGSSDSKEECKTNHPELIETQAECSSKYPTTGPTTDTGSGGGSDSKEECKTNHPELIETQAECKTSHPDLIEQSECQCDGGAGIPDCPANFQIRQPNCNNGATPVTQANCETGYTRVASGQNIAYKCKWNSAAVRER